MEMKFTGLVLWVQDNTVSVKFYKRLGFDVAESNERHSIVKLGNLELTLVSMRDDDEFTGDSLANNKGRGMYIYINVSNADAWYRELQERGITPRTEPRDWNWGNREFVVKDPDGYKLCFWQKSS